MNIINTCMLNPNVNTCKYFVKEYGGCLNSDTSCSYISREVERSPLSNSNRKVRKEKWYDKYYK